MTADKQLPPRLAERMVAWLVTDARWREVLLGDLAEEFDVRLERRAAWRARLWYWRQAFALLPRRLTDPVRSLLSPTGDTLMHAIVHEIRLAFRALARQRLATAIILVTLALTLGANAVSFGLADRLVLRPYGIAGVDQLVLVSEGTGPNQRRSRVPIGRFLGWRDSVTTLTNLVAFRGFSVNVSGANEPERIDGQKVSAGFFELLGAAPALGRAFVRSDESADQSHRVILSDTFWRRRFDAAPDVVGRTIRLDGEAYDVVGVAPPAFDFPEGTQLWVPLDIRAEDSAGRSSRNVSVIAALSAGMGLSEARADLSTIYSRQQADDPAVDRQRRIFMWEFTEGMIGNGTPLFIRMLQMTALFVLLIGCTNIASLLLASGAERQRDFGLRLALGASRGQLVRQLLIENAVLALLSAPIALASAWGVFQLLRPLVPPPVVKYIPGWSEVGVDWRLALFALGASVVASFLFGLLPALASSRVAPTVMLREGGRSMTRGPGRLGRGLVVLEIALALPLLVASAMTALAGRQLAYGPQGYNPDGIYQFRTILASSQYTTDDTQRQFVDRLLEQTRQIPGVSSAAVTSILPSTNTYSDRRIAIDRASDDRESPRYANYRQVSPDYLSTMEIPMAAGRSFTNADSEAGQRVSIVSAALARRYFGNASPLGHRIRVSSSENDWTTVVGIAGDTIDDWINARGVPTIYVPFAQFPTTAVNLIARTSGDPSGLASGLSAAVAAVDRRQPTFNGQTMRQQIAERTSGLRLVAGLMGGLGVLALVLASLGIYGLMANTVTQRRHEFGVRMALGATAGDVLTLTVRRGGTLTAIGVTVGLIGAFFLTRAMSGPFSGLFAADPRLIGAVTAVLVGVALVATVVPARRSVRLDPAAVLRE